MKVNLKQQTLILPEQVVNVELPVELLREIMADEYGIYDIDHILAMIRDRQPVGFYTPVAKALARVLMEKAESEDYWVIA